MRVINVKSTAQRDEPANAVHSETERLASEVRQRPCYRGPVQHLCPTTMETIHTRIDPILPKLNRAWLYWRSGGGAEKVKER
jgi:hypothetical protein